uniref:Class I SAM-dependent methyltransferase n=1 Tax=Ignisphaera aggregans TaxID=334771 RepID=A0A7C5XHS5_9CREN
MLHALGVKENDVVLDLGCGDGRVLLRFCRYGAFGICVELNKILCNVFDIVSENMGVKNKVKIYCTDFFKINLKEIIPRPTIVYLFLYPSTLESLSHKLENELDPGTIIVTLDFAIKGWSPFYVKSIVDENNHDRLLWFYAIGISNPNARRIEYVNQEELNLIERNLSKRKLFLY